MNKKLISWNNYLYIGLLFAVLNTIVEGSSDGYEQLALFALFFVFTGIKENVGLLRRFVSKFPAFAGFTLLSTLYFLFINRNEYLSYRYAGTIFCLVFAGYCISDQGKESVEMAMEKLWAVLMVLLGVAVVNHVMIHEFENRMNLFFLNPIPEGDAAVVLMLISLFFIHSKVKKATGVAVACGGALFTISRSCLMLLFLVFLIYIITCRAELKAFARKKQVLIACFLIVFALCVFVLARLVNIVTITYLIQRLENMFETITKDPYLNYYGDGGVRYRVIALVEAIKVARSGDFMKILFGRGLMSTFNAIAPATKALSHNTVAGPVENAFISLLSDFGVCAFVLYLCMFISALKMFFTSHNKLLRTLSVFVVVVMSTTLFSDMQYWSNIAYFIWVFSGLWLGTADTESDRSAVLVPLCFGMCAAMLLYTFPLIHSWLRTVLVTIYDGTGKIASAMFVFALILTICSLSWKLCELFESVIGSDFLVKRRIKGVLIGIGLMTLIIMLGNFQIGSVEKNVIERIDVERSLLTTILEGAEGEIYNDTYPYIYNKELGNIKGTLFSGASLANGKNKTVIMDSCDEAQNLTDAGFLYLQLPGGDSIYTNDQGVINKLIGAGYNPTGYNTRTCSIDLSEFDKYGAQHTESGILLYGGAKGASFLGSANRIYPGQYTANVKIGLVDTGYNSDDYDVCAIRLLQKEGEKTEKEIASLQLKHSSFNKSGELSIDLPFNAEGFEYAFQFVVNSDIEIKVGSIDYTRTPEYDTHIIVDDDFRVVLEEYYNIDGKPIVVSGGYHGVEYGYSTDANWNRRSFLDIDLAPVLSNYGYYEIHRELDSNLRTIREEYFGIDGEPIALEQGQAAVSYYYNDSANIIEIRYYDEKFEPILYDGQYFCVRNYCDSNGWIVRQEFLGIDDKPIQLSDGAYGYKREYDSNGNVVMMAYLGVDGEPSINAAGYAIVRCIYDDGGRVIRGDYHDEHDQPIALHWGQASVEYEYDGAGNTIVERYYDIFGSPTLYNGEYWYFVRVYNDKNQCIHEDYYGIDGQLTLCSAGYCSVDFNYDDSGTLVGKTYYDESGVIVAEE